MFGHRSWFATLATALLVPRTKLRPGKSNLATRLLALQADMQQRIASDLHDATWQHLLDVSLSMMRMRPAAADVGSAIEVCDMIDALIRQALKEIAAFNYLLHPENLIERLKSAIERFVMELSSRASLEAHLKIDAAVDELPYETQRSMLRVAQEALANVLRHAKATQVNISIKATDNNITFRISDNGCGMPASQAKHDIRAISVGVGIPSMRARLDQLGGTFEIRPSYPAKPSGTAVYATIPPESLKTGPGQAADHRPRRIVAPLKSGGSGLQQLMLSK